MLERFNAWLDKITVNQIIRWGAVWGVAVWAALAWLLPSPITWLLFAAAVAGSVAWWHWWNWEWEGN